MALSRKVREGKKEVKEEINKIINKEDSKNWKQQRKCYYYY